MYLLASSGKVVTIEKASKAHEILAGGGHGQGMCMHPQQIPDMWNAMQAWEVTLSCKRDQGTLRQGRPYSQDVRLACRFWVFL